MQASGGTTAIVADRALPDLHCPLCDYDVRGIPEPRCPECGHTFEWAELTDSARRKLPWLFEHSATPVRWAQTQLRALWPAGFWRTLRPSHQLYPGRLWVYLGVSMLLVLFGAGLALGSEAVALERRLSPVRAIQIIPQTPVERSETLRLLALTFPKPTSVVFWRMLLRQPTSGILFQVAALLAMLPVATGVVLGVMVQSFRRAKIKRAHQLRVAAYAAEPFLAAIALSILGAWMFGDRLFFWGRGGFTFPDSLGMLAPVGILWLWGLGRTEVATRKYLGMPRAGLVALGIAIINVLFALVTFMTVAGI